MKLDEDERGLNCCSNPRLNCRCKASDFKNCTDDSESSDDRVRCPQTTQSAYIDKLYKRLKAHKKRSTSSIWTSFQDNLDSGLSGCDKLSDSSSVMAKSSGNVKRDRAVVEGSPVSTPTGKTKTVNRNNNSHSVSSSDESNDETSLGNLTQTYHGSESSSAEEEFGYTGDHRLSSEEEVVDKSHLLSSEDDQVSGNHKKRYSVSCSSDDQTKRRNDFVTNSEMQSAGDKNLTVQPRHPDSDKVYRDKSLTQDEEEELSDYSMLLDESLLKKNNIWLLQCPISVDCKELMGQYLDLDNSSILQAGGEKYETFTYRSENDKHTTLAVPNAQHNLQISRIPIAGSIIVEEYIGVGDASDFIAPDSPVTVQLPKNLRKRHPLLGVEYKKQPKTAERRVKKEKRKKHSEINNSFIDVPIKTEYDSTAEFSPKKKKKRKRDSDINAFETDFSMLHSPKKKKIKSEFPDVSIKVEYDSTVESSPKKKKKRKRESDNSALESEMSLLEQNPKKKKIKSEFPDEMEESFNEDQEVKRKKKKHKIENCA